MIVSVRAAVRAWYGPRRRAYAWRRRPTPYRVLVSEVMLQQTQTPRVDRPFRTFVRRFPSVRSLAAASRAEVLRAWAGLGYNRRAVNLHEAARTIVLEHGGRVPASVEALRRLPGVGPYTAAAVASIAFGAPAAAVDVNVERISSRFHLGVEPHQLSRAEVRRLADGWLDRDHPGDWNQALMDIGREHCRPVPRCVGCPLALDCSFRKGGRGPGREGMATRRDGPAPRRPSSGQPRFEGSFRQVRGAVVAALRDRERITLRGLVEATGHDADRVVAAVAALAEEGMVAAGPAALAGRPAGRVRLGTD